jgi:prolipoprotein diacylglyceryl transferase
MNPLLRLSIPSPSTGVWHLWIFPVRAYALCILTGVIVSVSWANHRWAARGGRPGAITDMTMWAFPAGLVGARIYHLVTDPELYFVRGRDPWDAFAIWHGGLGIWGGVAGGVLGARYAARRYGWRLSDLAWAVAPALPVAQAIGRVGNWFNSELYGRPSTLPWALRIAPDHRPDASPLATTYQPTFLYELVWDLGVAALVAWAQRRFRLSGWASFALYAASYTAGRGWIEALRDDHANHILGLRVNDWVSIVVFLAAVLAFTVLRRQPPPSSFAAGPAGADREAIDQDGSDPPGSPPDRAGVSSAPTPTDR